MTIPIASIDFQYWIDKNANLNTFIGLVVGILGLILAVYYYKKQKSSTNKKKDIDVLPKPNEPYLGVSIKVEHTFRKFIGYGASCGEIIPAGNFRANYEVEVELTITIQNESSETIYEVEVDFIPNNYSNKYTLKDPRQNILQPLEENKFLDFTLRITKTYYDVYATDVDKDIHEIYKIGKDVSLLNGSKINIKYRDSNHKKRFKSVLVE